MKNRCAHSMGHYGLSALLLLLFVVATLHAQTATPDSTNDQFRIKLQVRVVQVDVVVTKEKDEAVTGLHKEDFQLFEDGDPQTISFFEEHKGAAPTRVEFAPLGANEFSNRPTMKTTDSINVLLVDSLNTQPNDQASVRAQVVKYLQSVSPSTRIAVFLLGTRLRMIRGITDDSSSVMKAFDDEKAGRGPEASSLVPTDSQRLTDREIIEAMTRNDNTDVAIDQVRDYQKQAATRLVDLRIGFTLEAFQQVARYLSPFAGRKNLIWISSSFPVNFSPQSGAGRKNHIPKPQDQRDIKATADLLADEQIAVYPIGAAGLAVNTMHTVDNPGRSASEQNTELSNNQIIMESLAQDTGGKAYYNMNSLAEAMAKAVDHGSRYYSLAYAPTRGDMDGKYRQIQVKVVSGDYKLVHRLGYYADDTATPQKADQQAASDPLLPLLGFEMPDFAQILYNVRVLPTDPQPARNSARAGTNKDLKKPVTRYRVDFAISAQGVALLGNPDGGRHGSVEVKLIAYDHDGKPVNLVGKKIPISMQPKTSEEALQTAVFQFHEDIDLPMGDLYIRTGIYDLTSTHAGTLGFPLKVITPPTGSLR